MTEFLIALVPMAAAIVPILRWPTRERRLRTHLALLKDLPAGVNAGTLRSLVEEEMQLIARRDRRWLTYSAHQRRRELAARAAVSVVGLAGYVPLILTADFRQWFSELAPEAQYAIVVYGIAALIIAQWLLATYSIRLGSWREGKRQRTAS